MGKERDYIVHDENNIKGFFGEYRWLSNYHLTPIEYEGITYPSTEHAYQAAKTLDIELRKEFLGLSCKDARLKGQGLDKRPNWENIKFNVMRDVIYYKFNTNSELKEKLILTGDKYLEETNHWNDIVFGVCEGKGINRLGAILMVCRKQLIKQKMKNLQSGGNRLGAI